MNLAEYKVGMKVRFIDEKSHKENPEFYPAVGTIGEIKYILDYNIFVKWPKGTTLEDGVWYCHFDCVVPVDDNNNNYDDITDSEIYEMLEPKLKKNGIMVFGNALVKAVALAYRCGYIRGQKGRPFKYNDKVTD